MRVIVIMLSRVKYIISRLSKKIRINRFLYLISLKFLKDDTTFSYDINKERCVLEEFSKKPNSTAIGQNIIHKKRYDLQIVIPCYNCEKTIKKCIDSILNQKTRYSFLLYIIDDGSTDDSYRIIEEYSGYENINIIKKENGGVSTARNLGIKNIYSNYITFMDSDDEMNCESIDLLLNEAYKYHADIVQGSYVSVVNKIKKIKITQKNGQISKEDLSGYVWDKIFMSELFKNFIFPENILFEDTNLAFLVYENANIIRSIDNCVCIHSVNRKGLTSTSVGKNKSVDTYWISEILDNDRKLMKYKNSDYYLKTILNQFIMNYKRTYLLNTRIKKCIFYMECELLKNRFSDSKNDYLQMFKEYNYELYNLYTYWLYL